MTPKAQNEHEADSLPPKMKHITLKVTNKERKTATTHQKHPENTRSSPTITDATGTAAYVNSLGLGV